MDKIIINCNWFRYYQLFLESEDLNYGEDWLYKALSEGKKLDIAKQLKLVSELSVGLIPDVKFDDGVDKDIIVGEYNQRHEKKEHFFEDAKILLVGTLDVVSHDYAVINKITYGKPTFFTELPDLQNWCYAFLSQKRLLKIQTFGMRCNHDGYWFHSNYDSFDFYIDKSDHEYVETIVSDFAELLRSWKLKGWDINFKF